MCPGACRESEDGVKESMGRSLSFYPVGLGGGGAGTQTWWAAPLRCAEPSPESLSHVSLLFSSSYFSFLRC